MIRRTQILIAFIACTAFAFNSNAQSPCIDGMANGFPCHNVDFWSFLSIEELGGGNNTNDIWGWTHEASGREFAIVGKNNGTAFVDVTVPTNPIYLGSLPTHTLPSLWRDVKVYADHAFIVSEASGHGMQVFDLNRLIAPDSIPSAFDADAHYDNFGRAHNIVINEATGYAYAVGTQTFDGGLHIVDINDPLNPVIAGDFSQDGYTHDAQAVIYHGPDDDHCGREIVFAANENTLTIVDVDDKLDAFMISSVGYESAYAHQCWVTEDHKYVLLGDELDELQGLTEFTKTFIFDIQDLDNPVLIGEYVAESTAIDHNLYIRWNQVFQSNYRSGLRVLDASRVAEGTLSEIGYFDVTPSDDDPSFQGSWSNYPYFESGTVILTDMYGGLFVVRPHTVTAETQLFVNSDETFVEGEVYFSYVPQTFNLVFGDLPVGLVAETVSQSFPGVVRYSVSGIASLDPGDHTFTLTIQHEGDETVRDVTITKTDVFTPGIYLISPENMSLGLDPVFTWDATEDATVFHFELSLDEDFTMIVHEESTTETSVEVPFTLLPGGYFWRVEGEGACDRFYSSAVFLYTEQVPDNITEIQPFRLSVYPNPAQSYISLRVTEDHVGMEAKIIDLSGRTVDVIRIGSDLLQIDISGYTPGWYNINLEDGSQTEFIKK